MKTQSRIWTALTAAALILGVAASPVSAHHSFALYDPVKSSEITGVVEKFEWSNPHSWLFVSVTKPTGETVSYGFEMQSVGEMLRRGWHKTSVKVGDKVKVTFRAMRDGTPAGLLQSVTDADGHLIGKPPGAA